MTSLSHQDQIKTLTIIPFSNWKGASAWERSLQSSGRGESSGQSSFVDGAVLPSCSAILTKGVFPPEDKPETRLRERDIAGQIQLVHSVHCTTVSRPPLQLARTAQQKQVPD